MHISWKVPDEIIVKVKVKELVNWMVKVKVKISVTCEVKFKGFIQANFNYCPLVWFFTSPESLKEKLNVFR